MTSCKFTSGFVFGHEGTVVVSHVCTEVCGMFVQYGAFSILYKIQYGRRPPSWISWGNSWATHEDPLMVVIVCKYFVMIAFVVL